MNEAILSKITKWTLYAAMGISVIVLAIFYFGGQSETPIVSAELNEPKYLDWLLYWCYAMLASTIISLIGFGLYLFFKNLMVSPKSAIVSFGILIVFAALLGISYTMGGDTPLPGINVDSAKYNVPFWLKLTDMWLYTFYILLSVCILAVLAGSLQVLFPTSKKRQV